MQQYVSVRNTATAAAPSYRTVMGQKTFTYARNSIVSVTFNAATGYNFASAAPAYSGYFRPATGFTRQVGSQTATDVTPMSTAEGAVMDKAAPGSQRGVTWVTYYAPKSYTVTYNLNGGTIGTSTANVTGYVYYGDTFKVGQRLTSLSQNAWEYTSIGTVTPPAGMQFVGWKDNLNSTVYAANASYNGSATWNKTSGVTFTAQYENTASHVITLMTNGGAISAAGWTAVTANSQYIYTQPDGTAVTLPTPALSGYIWGGWYATGSFTGSAVTSVAASNTTSKTFYGKWYNTVSYDANGGSGAPATGQKIKGMSYTVAAAPTIPPAFTVSFDPNGGTVSPASQAYNAVFAAWNTLADSTGRDYAPGSSYTTDGAVTFYARWRSATYANLPTPTRANYAFVGWYTAAEFGSPVTNGETMAQAASHTLSARWPSATMPLTLDPNGGAWSGGAAVTAPRTVTPGRGTTFHLPTDTATGDYGYTLSRTGYTFTFWSSPTDGALLFGDYTVPMLSAEETLTAHWEPITYTVTYNANGATSGTVPAQQVKNYGETLTLAGNPGNLTKTGFTLDGWTSCANGEKAYDLGAAYSANETITLYAHWARNVTTLTMNPNGGEWSDGIGNTLLTVTVPYNCYFLLANILEGVPIGDSNGRFISRTGYRFDGWVLATSGNGALNGNTYIAGPIANGTDTVIAQWTRYTTVLLDANGGACAVEYIETLPGEPYGALPTPTRANFVFRGWSLSPDADQFVTAETVVTNPQNHVLYARWQACGTVIVERVNVLLSDSGSSIVEVPVRLTHNPGLIAALARVTYDPNVLTLTEVIDGGLFGAGNMQGGGNIGTIPYAVSWEDGAATQDHTDTGLLMTLRFTIVPNAPLGWTDVCVAGSSPDGIPNSAV